MWIATIAAAALAGGLVLPDHLEPCGPDPLLLEIGKAGAVRKRVEEGALRRDLVARLVARGSVEAPWMVSVYVDATGATVEWAQGRDVKWAPVDDALAKRVGALWTDAIAGVRYPPLDSVGPVGFDGVRYAASRYVKGHGHVCGTTWSPDSGQDVPYAVVTAGVALGRLARSEDAALDEALDALDRAVHPPPPEPEVEAPLEIRFAPVQTATPDDG